MAIKREVAPGGRVKLRHTSGAKSGEMAGEVSLKALGGIDTPTRPPLPYVGADVFATPDVTETYLRFARNEPGVYEADPAEDFDPAELRAKWLTQLPEPEQLAYLTARTLPAGLGEDQARYAFEALRRSAKNNKNAWDLQDPTDEEWQEYLTQAAERIADPRNELSEDERLALLDKLGVVAAGPKPDAVTFATCLMAPSRTWRARYELDDHARQIGSWVDADEWEVRAAVSRFRDEYYARLDAGEEPAAPEQYFNAWRRIRGVVPKDEATIYSHWKAEDPTLYLNPRAPKKYIALDLETTGISTRDHHIIEIGLVEYDASGRELGRWNQLVRPPVGSDGVLSTGDETVMKVHQITPGMVADAPTISEVIPELRERLAGATIIGHNLAFDTKHIRANLRREAGPDDREAGKAPWTGEADTMLHASRHMTGLENNKLVTVSGSLGIPYTNGHRAEHDAAVAGEVFFAIRQSLKDRQAAAIAAYDAD